MGRLSVIAADAGIQFGEHGDIEARTRMITVGSEH